MPKILRQHSRCARFSWQCLVFRPGTFLLSGHVNSTNSIFWGSTSLSTVCKGHYTLKFTAWIAMSKHGIIGLFLFEDDNEHCVTINTDQYVQVFLKFWTALGWQKEIFRVRQWFQQDDTTPNTSKESLAWLKQRFSDRLISRKCDPQWSPYSTDLIFISGDNLRTGFMPTIPKVFLT